MAVAGLPYFDSDESEKQPCGPHPTWNRLAKLNPRQAVMFRWMVGNSAVLPSLRTAFKLRGQWHSLGVCFVEESSRAARFFTEPGSSVNRRQTTGRLAPVPLKSACHLATRPQPMHYNGAKLYSDATDLRLNFSHQPFVERFLLNSPFVRGL